MANRLTVKQMLSRIRETFPEIQETYALALINDALTEAGKFNVKYESATTDSVSATKWYTINDANSGIEVNKITNVYFMDDDGYYRMIKRLVHGKTNIQDVT